MFLLAVIVDLIIVGAGVYGMFYSFRKEVIYVGDTQVATSLLTIGILGMYWLLAEKGIVPFIF